MEHIVLVGGQLHNKGAQAMTYTVVDALKKKFPEKEIVLFASVYTERDEEEKKKLNFKVLPWDLNQKLHFVKINDRMIASFKDNIKTILKKGISKKNTQEISSILKNTTSIIDISGYALSSQRGEHASINYLLNIAVAQNYNIPMYLFPQSFGPFDYKENKQMIRLIRNKLTYPRKIYAREKDGVRKLSEINLSDNIDLTLDIVLQAKEEIDFENIFINKTPLNFEIMENSISIIPNDKIMQHGDKEKIQNIYVRICEEVLSQGKNIYLLRHSYEDLYICEKIKSAFQDDERVILIQEDLDCIEINNVLKQFDYIVASRYHSIIHGYRNGIPALVLGWAIKYQELLERFNQNNYLFDVRGNLQEAEIIKSVKMLEGTHVNESKNIKNFLKEIRSKNIFEDVN